MNLCYWHFNKFLKECAIVSSAYNQPIYFEYTPLPFKISSNHRHAELIFFFFNFTRKIRSDSQLKLNQFALRKSGKIAENYFGRIFNSFWLFLRLFNSGSLSWELQKHLVHRSNYQKTFSYLTQTNLIWSFSKPCLCPNEFRRL